MLQLYLHSSRRDLQIEIVSLSLSTNPGGCGLHILGSLHGGLLCFVILASSWLLCCCLLGVLCSPDSLLSLGFPHLGLLVPLGHDVLESGAYYSTLELLCALGPLLLDILLQALLVLPPVEHSPGDLPGVPLEEVGLVGAPGQELVALAVSLDEGAAVPGVDLVARVGTQVNLHGYFLLDNLSCRSELSYLS